MNLRIALCLPREAETVAVARWVAGSMLGRLGVEPDCISDIQVTLSEACTNVIEHASATDEYEVRLEIDDDQCEISVIDAGHGLDAAELNRSMPSPSDERGRGLALMRALADRIDLTSEPATGTVVRLVKQLTLA